MLRSRFCALSVVPGVLLVLASPTAIRAAEGRTPVYQAGTVITAGGRYIVTQNLTGTGSAAVIEVAGNGGVDIDLNGFELNNGAGPAPVILLTNANNNAIHGGQLVGGGIGIDFPGGGGNTVIEDVRIRASGGDGVHILAGGNHALRRVTVLNAGGYGINVDVAGSVRIEDSYVRFTAADGIRLHSGGSHRVVRTTVSNTTGRGIAIDSNSFDAWIQDSRVVDTTQEGIYAVSTSRGAIWGNVVSAAGGDCIRLASGSSHFSIRENHVNGCGNQSPFVGDGIRIEGSNCSVERNHCSGNVDWGLHFTSTSSSNTFGRNTAVGNSGAPPSCTGTSYDALNFCNEGTGNATFGDNLIPTLN